LACISGLDADTWGKGFSASAKLDTPTQPSHNPTHSERTNGAFTISSPKTASTVALDVYQDSRKPDHLA
jgi:hypothetical protein